MELNDTLSIWTDKLPPSVFEYISFVLTVYKDILDNCVLQTLWQYFVEGPHGCNVLDPQCELSLSLLSVSSSPQ